MDSIHPAAELRDPSVVWYGPHQCPSCGSRVVRQEIEAGGLYFDAQPRAMTEDERIIYPNEDEGLELEWTAHTCKDANVEAFRRGAVASETFRGWAQLPNGDIQLTMTLDDWKLLVVTLGYGGGALVREGDLKVFHKQMAMMNRINAGNPHWTPYDIPPDPA